MKNLSKFAFGAMALALAACSSEAPVPNNGNDVEGDVYATLNIKLPTGTRAAAGQEYGQDTENYVGKVLVVLTHKVDNKYMFLTYDEADAMDGGQIAGDHENVSVNELTYTLNFSAKNMKPGALDIAGENGMSDVYVFAFCNPTSRLQNTVSQLANEEPGTVEFSGNSTGEINDKNTIWGDKKFLMANCHEPAAVKLPSRASLVQNNNKPEKAFNLGTVHVKRLAARFDFALGGENKDNKYTIKNTSTGAVMGTVELTDMAMFNIAKNFYYLPRSNSQWDWNGTTFLCGDLESPYYVMSYNQGGFKQKNLADGNYKQYYFANLIGNAFRENETEEPVGGSTKLTWTSIKPEVWNTKTEDFNEGWTQEPKQNDYRIWRYATENTIPAADPQNSTAAQKIGITTGVVFKGTFTPANTEVWNGNVIYLYNGVVYGDFAALKAYVTKYPESGVAKAFNGIGALKNATNPDPKTNLLDGLDSNARNGFKAYVPDQNKNTYTMYYFYYNRHESNGNNSQMGVNEFGVVRNNVYKLQVTTCGSLGEPNFPENPDTPDEQEDAYFTVSCHVMPWTVRINNIEF